MRLPLSLLFLGVLIACGAGCATRPAVKRERAHAEVRKEPLWFGVHVFVPSRDGLPILKRMIAEALPPLGVNVLVLEVNYRFAYQSHPELIEASGPPITKEDARELAALCRSHGIRLIPQFNCLGHQSWGNKGGTLPLLVKHPELDETPWVPASNEGIYCRSWCPLHPKVNEIVFALMDEIIDAFQPDAFHVGMDEVFLIADSQCPRCKGKNPAELFAKAVNDYHQHLVDEKKLTMLMWGDRLLDQAVMKYNMWESSQNGTAPAIDMIPKDLVVCDWHYGKRNAYPSVPYFQEKGLRVWPASWHSEEGALALLEYAQAHATDEWVGHLCTTWVSPSEFTQALLGEGDTAKLGREVVGAAQSVRACAERMKAGKDTRRQ